VSRAARLAAWALAACAILVYAARHTELASDFTSFLPDARDAELAAISRALAHGEAARTMLLTIGAGDPARAVAAARTLAAELEGHPEVAWLRAGPSASFAEDVHALYFPRRMYFAAEDPARELPQRLSDAGLAARARALLRELASPASPLADALAPEDPLGLFAAQTSRLAAAAPALSSQDGVFTTADGRYAVILLGTVHSAFDSAAQRPLLEAIETGFAGLRARFGDDLALESAGPNRFAVASEDAIRADVALISAVSAVGVALLSLLFFRSLVSLALAFVPAVAGLVLALGASLALFGRVDGLTLAFGASLIGVAIDYPTHYLILKSFAPAAESPRALARRLAPSLALAALTTMASFAGLALTSFPGFRELGVFSAIGVGGALAATLWLLPDLFPARARPAPISASLSGRLAGQLDALRAHRRALALVPALVVGFGVVALPRLAWNDDLTRLAQPPEALRAEDLRVRERVGGAEPGRFVVALGADPEQALARSEAVDARLAPLVASGALGGARSLGSLVWSRERQLANLEALRASPDLAERIDRAFRAEGFRAGAFAPFASALAAPPAPLELAELRASPLGPLAASLALDVGERTAALTELRGVRDPDALRAALAGLPGVELFDQRAFVNDVYARFRARTLRQIALGSVLVLLLLVARYRDLRRAFAAFLPSALVAIALLSAYAWTGTEANLLHAVGLVIVMGMGVDYGIFIVDAAEQPEDLGPTLVSCLLCCLTTLLGFGALALSENPALRALGITTGVGVALSFLFAPVTLLALRADARPRGA
jgi:predicted exporter